MFHLPETAGSCHVWEPAADLITFAVKSKSHIGRFGWVAVTVVASSWSHGSRSRFVYIATATVNH